MERFRNLSSAAHGQFKEKGIGGMTSGMRADSGLMKLDGGGLLITGEASSQVVKSLLDDECKEKTCMQGRVMEKSWMNSLGFMDLMVPSKTIQSLVETRATHNFMMTQVEKEVGLMIFP